MVIWVFKLDNGCVLWKNFNFSQSLKGVIIFLWAWDLIGCGVTNIPIGKPAAAVSLVDEATVLIHGIFGY